MKQIVKEGLFKKYDAFSGPTALRLAVRVTVLATVLGGGCIQKDTPPDAGERSQTSGTGSSPDEVTLMPNWAAGEMALVEITRVGEDTNAGKTSLKIIVREDVQIKVLTADQKGYTLAWTLMDCRFDDSHLAQNILSQRILAGIKGLEVILDLDRSGSIRGVRNWEEVRTTTETTARVILAEVARSDIDKSLLPKLREMVDSMLTKSNIEASCMIEPSLCFAFLGRSYSTAAPLICRGEVMYPVMGDTVPCINEFVLKSKDSRTGRVSISFSETVAAEELWRSTEKMVKQMSSRFEKPLPAERFPRTISSERKVDYVVDPRSGWFDTITERSVLKVDLRLRTQTTTIKRKTP